MKDYRTIKNIFDAPMVSMGPHRLRQAIPMSGLDQFSPFILLHHFNINLAAGQSFNVPPHPHRGFCPITFMFEGKICHKDSLGNDQTIGRDEVQWINAGSGLIHSESANEDFIKEGGLFEGIQLWINLKQEDKMKSPSYQPITNNELILIEQDGIEFRLVSGECMGFKGPGLSDTITAMLRMKSNSQFEIELPISNNTCIYVLNGELLLNNQHSISNHQLITFENVDGTIMLASNTDCKLLILSGEAINEPLVSHGPFVMNTEEEIHTAIYDYQLGKMGTLSES